MRIGIDLGGTKIEGIILNNEGSVTEKIRVDTPKDNYKDTVHSLCSLVVDLQKIAGTQLSVGIGTPGALSFPEKLVKNSNSVSLNGQPLQKDIEAKIGYEVRLENDANCFVLSEASYGAGAKFKTVFGVIIGTGTGGGIVINKELHTGPNSIAGEWGHNCIPSSVRDSICSDRRCHCGRTNCIETVLSGRGLKQTYLDSQGQEYEAMQIANNAKGGDTGAQQCLDIYCLQLANCLSTVVNLLDPDMIVLGGGLSNIDYLYEKVPKLMNGIVFTKIMQTKLAKPRFGDASGAIGAACLWPSSWNRCAYPSNG
jgi:fructokinase